MNTPAPSFAGEIRRDDLPALFAVRDPDTHKGSFGTVGVVGGGRGMEGAALLAARAALKTGAGKVLVGFAQDAAPLPCDPLQPELMLRDARSLLDTDWGVTAWVAGCGIGAGAAAANALSELFVLRGGAPLVLDADGLNLLANGGIQPNWGDGPVVLTPPRRRPGAGAALRRLGGPEGRGHRGLRAGRHLVAQYQRQPWPGHGRNRGRIGRHPGLAAGPAPAAGASRGRRGLAARRGGRRPGGPGHRADRADRRRTGGRRPGTAQRRADRLSPWGQKHFYNILGFSPKNALLLI